MVSDHCPVFRLHFTQSVASFRSCFPVGYGKINIKETFSIIKNGHSERENGYSEGKGGHSNINVNIGKAGRGYEGL